MRCQLSPAAIGALGGFAAKLHGSPALTVDIDICYARDAANLERLVAALAELHPTLRGADEGLPFLLDAVTIRNGDSFTFVTDAGDLDILGTPAGTSGYDELAANAVRMDLQTVQVEVASIDDLMTMKRASGRPRDQVHLEILAAIRDEMDQSQLRPSMTSTPSRTARRFAAESRPT